MGYALLGEPDANSYFYYSSSGADVEDGAPADVSDFLDREGL